MEITLYVNNSERQAINKTLTSELTLTGSLRSESSVINPSFIIETQNPSAYNYCYIPEFGRYYFITDITSVRTNLWRIECSVDVLMSFKTPILNLDVVISDDTSPDPETYMNGDVWQTLVKDFTDILNFQNGLLNQGEYILITSGGVAS